MSKESYYQIKSHTEYPFQNTSKESIEWQLDDEMSNLFYQFIMKDFFSLSKRSLSLFKFMLTLQEKPNGNIILDRQEYMEYDSSASSNSTLEALKSLLSKRLIAKGGVKNTYWIDRKYRLFNNNQFKLILHKNGK